jgi:hypothetical protein
VFVLKMLLRHKEQERHRVGLTNSDRVKHKTIIIFLMYYEKLKKK